MPSLLRRAACCILAAFVVYTEPSFAAVTQPDGTQMPLPGPGNEVSLQELFDFREGAGAIDSFADASTEPSTFKPLCTFSAQLLLHETSGKSPMGWYNVPVDDVPPDTVCDESTGMNNLGEACSEKDIFVLVPGDVVDPPFGEANDPLNNPGQVFTSAELASHEHYAGGAIGFVLLTPQKHYSELRLNPECVDAAGGAGGFGANCAQGDHWIPTIMYASAVDPQTYYMGSEDQAVGPSEWGGNDGDFNDFVFVFTGLVCSGSGEVCDTGQPGICAAGLTACADADGNSECLPARSPEDESCNALDDDCNGETDEGDLCAADEICLRGRCFPRCGTGEFRCTAGFTCVQGACVEDACVDVECDAGEICRAGECVGACDDVVCPYGQNCQDGACVDPCAGIECAEGLVCSAGACIVECTCAGCEQGECDAPSGLCVDAGCAGVSCDEGSHCSGGSCVNDCEGALCPGGGECSAGVCAPPSPSAGAGGAGETGSGGTIVVGIGGTGNSGNSTSGNAGGNAGETSDAQGSGRRSTQEAGCACRLGGAGQRGAAALVALFAGALFIARRRRRAA